MRKSCLFLFAALLGIFIMPASSGRVIAQSCGGACEPEDCSIYGYPPMIWSTTLCTCVPRPSPILIDIAGDGYDLTNAVNGVKFDLDSNGRPEQLSWTSGGSDDAFLALDRDGDGLITSGRELFGNFTEQPVTEDPNGFIALGVFDTNGDHWIDANDAIYQRLQLWIDSNHDGVSQRRELFSLNDKGVEGISCNYRLSKRSDRYGNLFRFKALARINGVKRWVWDIFFLLGN